MTTNKSNNTTTMMEETTMKDYTQMKWVELVAYAKSLGINTGHKKRFDIELELDELYDKEFDKKLEEENYVAVGDFSYDKYYIQLQAESMEQKILAAVNRAKFNATYKGHPVTYIMTKSLKSIIKGNLSDNLKNHPAIQAIVDRVIQKMINKNILYTCTKDFYGVR